MARNHPSEAQFRADVLDALHQLGYLATAIRRSDGVTLGHDGLPDVIAVHETTGAFLALELKVQRRHATAMQWRWVHALARRANVAAVITPDDWPAVARHAAELAGHRVHRPREANR